MTNNLYPTAVQANVRPPVQSNVRPFTFFWGMPFPCQKYSDKKLSVRMVGGANKESLIGCSSLLLSPASKTSRDVLLSCVNFSAMVGHRPDLFQQQYGQMLNSHRSFYLPLSFYKLVPHVSYGKGGLYRYSLSPCDPFMYSITFIHRVLGKGVPCPLSKD